MKTLDVVVNSTKTMKNGSELTWNLENSLWTQLKHRKMVVNSIKTFHVVVNPIQTYKSDYQLNQNLKCGCRPNLNHEKWL